jgi:hypothetical protein
MPGRISSAPCLEQEPSAPLGLVNPNFDQTGSRNVLVFFAGAVGIAPGECLAVLFRDRQSTAMVPTSHGTGVTPLPDPGDQYREDAFRVIGFYLTHERPTRPISKAKALGRETGLTFRSRGPDRQLAHLPSEGDSLQTKGEILCVSRQQPHAARRLY